MDKTSIRKNTRTTRKRKAVATAIATITVRDLPRGITRMTRDKHSFEGYAIRRQYKGWKFHRYVSASAKGMDAGAPVAEIAKSSSMRFLETLNETIMNPHNWRMGAIQKKVIKALTDMGFVCNGPSPSTAQPA